MEVRAVAKYMRLSPRKLRRIARQIEHLDYETALDVLTFEPSPNARVLKKVLESAGANAEENHDLSKDSLYVASAVVDGGPTLKRWRAGSMGRGMRVTKPTSHIRVTLTDEKPKGS